MKRITVTGQPIEGDLLLALPDSSRSQRQRLAQCFATEGDRVRFQPPGIFHVTPHAINKARFSFRPRGVGEQLLQLHTVDAERNALLGAWLVRVDVTPPPVTKTFDVKVQTVGFFTLNLFMRDKMSVHVFV